MFGAKLTLIVLTSQRLARIDLAGPRRHLRVERVLSCPPIASSELASAVAIAYRLGEPSSGPAALPKIGRGRQRSMIVLSDDVWNDAITLPLDVTVLLQPAEIQQALAIEAETFSGINAFASRCATRQLVDASANLLDTSTNYATGTTWWVAQIAGADLAAMSASAQACGVQFLGATHWHAPWRISQTSPPITNAIDSPATWLELGQHWAQALSSDGHELLIRPEATDLRQQRLGWLQASAALTTMLACAGVYHTRTLQLQATEAHIESLQKTLAEYEAVASKLQAATAKLQTRQKTTPPDVIRTQLVTTTPDPLPSVNSSQWLAIFDALTTQTPDDCWIESWRWKDGRAILSGRAVTAQTIHELASRLEQALRDSECQVLPPVIQSDESQLLQFELSIVVRQTPHTNPLRTTCAPIDQSTLASHTSPGAGT